MTANGRPGHGFAMPRLPAEQPRQEEQAERPLPPDTTVDLVAERKASNIDEVLESLDTELVGLAPIKTRIREIAALLLVDRARLRFGLGATRPNLHMCFTGSPGTGKTTVALRMGELLHQLGYLKRGHLVAAGRDDLVGQYIGHTAPKTKEVIKRAMGGVLFIDEAYYLHRAENERDYGQEAIEILLQVMENHRDDLVVVLAGYRDRMDGFFRSNPGMNSRIAHHLEFPDYELEELMAIAHLMVDQENYRFTVESEAVFRRYLQLRMWRPLFANARSVRNAVERARLRQAGRLLATTGRVCGKQDLMTFEPEDFLPSREFSEQQRKQSESAHTP